MKSLATFVLCLVWESASAIPVTWKLNNVLFDDGRSAVGTFTYDADTNTLSDSTIRLIPNLGDPWPTIFDHEGHIYSQVPVDNTAQHAIFTYVSGFGVTDAVLALHFEAPLDNNGDETTIRLNDSNFPGLPYPVTAGWHNVIAGGDFQGLIQEQSNMISGTVTAVPIPAAVWLFGSALVGLGWFRRAQKVC
ncbi:MAG: PEP-CTERM sorting domain-containing protein [Gammaproteobacteria bacterium]